jgi:hypothetical protein
MLPAPVPPASALPGIPPTPSPVVSAIAAPITEQADHPAPPAPWIADQPVQPAPPAPTVADQPGQVSFDVGLPQEGVPIGAGPVGFRTAASFEPAGPQDPRVAAFGTGPVRPDPSALTVALRWAVPVGTGLLGVLIGVVLSSSADRPTAPVSISGPATTTTVTQQATVTAPAPAPVTRRVTATVRRTTTAPPPAPSTVRATETVTVTEERTVTVGARNPAPRQGNRGGRRRLLP